MSQKPSPEDVRRAIEHAELQLLYQPKVQIGSGRIAGVEALARWDHPQRGDIPPSEFIPVAEEAGLIDALGEWVLTEACRQRESFESAAPIRPLLMCVNVSSHQFTASFPDLLRGVISRWGLPPGSLGIEITESAVMTDVDAAIATISELRSLGVHVSLDDFGTGFSSLAQLKRLPLDELKVDKSFIDGLGRVDADTAIVAAIVAMAHALELCVTAEGVETADQLVALRTLGCELAQGFLLSRPVPAERIGDLLDGAAPLDFDLGRTLSAPRGRARDVVLVADDSPDVRRLVRVSLATSGFDIVEASSGLEAITAAKRFRPDCVVLDVAMPSLDGIEVCRALRSDPSTASCAVLMLTTNSAAEDKVEAFSAGADDYMVKPFAPRDIVARVRVAIDRRPPAASDTAT